MAGKSKTISLKDGEYDQVKFTDHSGDVFFVGLGSAIKYCKKISAMSADLDQDALELLVILEEWFTKKTATVGGVAIRPESNWLHFYFSSATDEFDVELSRQLAELESAAIGRLNRLRIDTRQVSTSELEEIRALGDHAAHAESEPASQSVEA